MKRYRHIIFVIMVAGITFKSWGTASTNNNSAVTMLNQSLSIRMHFTDIESILSYHELWNPIQLDIDPDVFQKNFADKKKCSVGIRNLEKRYILSWLIFLSDASATIRDDQSVHITTKENLSKSDPIFECYKEIQGEWYVALNKKLDKKFTAANVQDCSVLEYLNLLNQITSVQMLLDPVLFSDPELKKIKITVDSTPETSVREDLLSALKQAKLTCKIQGGVLFITK